MRRDRVRLQRIVQDQGSPGKGDPQAEARGRGPDHLHGLQWILRAGTDPHGPSRRDLLPKAPGQRHPLPRRRTYPQGPPGKEIHVCPPGGDPAGAEDEGHRVLQTPAADRPPQPRTDRSGEDRRIHRVRRLRSPGQSPQRHDLRGHHRGNHGRRTSRARRRGFPHRQKVAGLPPSQRLAQVPGL